MHARCCLLLCLAAVASAAQFNPRVSAREIAFNEPVRLTFATTRPQLEVDIARELRTALELPSVSRDWGLAAAPEVVQHEKAMDVTVTLLLRARSSGEVALPTIPVAWLEGKRSAVFPTVTVHNHIRVGSETRDLPVELEAVADYAWGSDRAAILAADSRNRVVEETGRETLIATPGGLLLRLLDGRLAEVRLVAEGLKLDGALGSFVQRWGTPEERGEERARWQLGWLDIEAVDGETGVIVTLVHQGIAGEATRKRVQGEIFRLLETGHGTAPVATPPVDDGAATTDGDDAAEATGGADGAEGTLSMDEIEAELRRRVGE